MEQSDYNTCIKIHKLNHEAKDKAEWIEKLRENDLLEYLMEHKQEFYDYLQNYCEDI